METLEINGQEHEIIGYGENGLPTIRGIATPIHHKDEQGNQIFDDQGNPKISTNITVPAAKLFAVPGEVK